MATRWHCGCDQTSGGTGPERGAGGRPVGAPAAAGSHALTAWGAHRHPWAATPDEPGPPLRVLVVVDTQYAADSAVLRLAVTGPEAAACDDGPAALAAAPAFRPGIRLINLHMPGTGGGEPAGCLHEAPGGRVLRAALTTMSDESGSRRIAGARFHPHLTNPVDPVKLVRVADARWRLRSSGGVLTPVRRAGRLSRAPRFGG